MHQRRVTHLSRSLGIDVCQDKTLTWSKWHCTALLGCDDRQVAAMHRAPLHSSVADSQHSVLLLYIRHMPRVAFFL